MVLIKVEGSAHAFRENYVDESRECFIGSNINNRSKSLLDKSIVFVSNTKRQPLEKNSLSYSQNIRLG